MSAVKFIITLVFQLRLFTEFAITQLNFRKKVDPSNFQTPTKKVYYNCFFNSKVFLAKFENPAKNLCFH